MVSQRLESQPGFGASDERRKIKDSLCKGRRAILLRVEVVVVVVMGVQPKKVFGYCENAQGCGLVR